MTSVSYFATFPAHCVPRSAPPRRLHAFALLPPFCDKSAPSSMYCSLSRCCQLRRDFDMHLLFRALSVFLLHQHSSVLRFSDPRRF